MFRLKTLRQFSYVGILSALVAVGGVLGLRYNVLTGPGILFLAIIPFAGLLFAKRRFKSALPDICFGAIDTGMLVIPALFGGMFYGVAGAIAGGVVGDALTDAIAGFFEGSISQWLRSKGIEESREAVTTSLGKMAGCLLGAGIILTLAALFGFTPAFAEKL